MYEPPLHRQDDIAAIHALIRARPLGLLVTHGTSGLLANAIPFLLDADVGRFGRLRAHLARANPQGRDLRETGEALVVFQGPDHYVSPGWYATKRETGKVVPTWNYLVAQARGAPKVIDDPDWLQTQIEALTATHEGGLAAPWKVGDAPDDYIAQQKRAIVGLEIEIADLRGKWKASQNRNEADRAGVVEGLAADSSEDAAAIAAAVRRGT
jgi:transcriptional regulator